MIRKQIENITFKVKTLYKMGGDEEEEKYINYSYYDRKTIDAKKIISLILKEKKIFKYFQENAAV